MDEFTEKTSKNFFKTFLEVFANSFEFSLKFSSSFPRQILSNLKIYFHNL